MQIYPWQIDMLKKMSQYKGRGLIQMTGRQAGKSVLNSAAFQRMWNDLYAERPVTDLILTETKLHGARYYCVQPEGGNWKDMEAWTKQTFGEPGDVWPSQDFAWPESPRWVQNNRKFWFRNEADRTMFVMKWR